MIFPQTQLFNLTRIPVHSEDGVIQKRENHFAVAGIGMRKHSGGQKEEKEKRRSANPQAPPLLRQRKPYLTGSPPFRQAADNDQMSHTQIITPNAGDARARFR
jgi:hypothetical protein